MVGARQRQLGRCSDATRSGGDLTRPRPGYGVAPARRAAPSARNACTKSGIRAARAAPNPTRIPRTASNYIEKGAKKRVLGRSWRPARTRLGKIAAISPSYVTASTLLASPSVVGMRHGRTELIEGSRCDRGNGTGRHDGRHSVPNADRFETLASGDAQRGRTSRTRSRKHSVGR